MQSEMGLLLGSALIALGVIGVWTQGPVHIYGPGRNVEPRLICISKQRNLIRQQSYLKRQLIRYQWQVNSLRTTCQLDVPDNLGIPPLIEGPPNGRPSWPPIVNPTRPPIMDIPWPYPTNPPDGGPKTDNPGGTTPHDIGPTRWPDNTSEWPNPSGTTPHSVEPTRWPDNTSEWPYPSGTTPNGVEPTTWPDIPSEWPNPSGTTPGWQNPIDTTPQNGGSTDWPNIPSIPSGWPDVPKVPSWPSDGRIVQNHTWTINVPSPQIITSETTTTTIISTTPLVDYWLTPKDIEEDSKLTTVSIIVKYGYPVETHFVTTQDNYVLCLHRIPRPGAPVVLLVHGLMSSSAIWVQMGPSYGLAYKLYHQGYDVWLLNTRGNLYSKAHKNPGIKPMDYWSFSFHEIGLYDLPATIDMIITISKQPNLQYIGHSQGSTAFFVMCSELPQYADKIILMQALSPTVFLQNTKSPVLRFLSLFKGKFGVLLNLLGGLEISKNNHLILQFRKHICSVDTGSQICAIFDYVMCGFGWSEFNATMTDLVVGHSSQGASSVQIYHYAQLLSGTKFHRFDKGALLNQVIYKDSDPPSYNLTRVTCKVALHYSEDDWLGGARDVLILKQRLPNCIDNSYIVQKGFSHYDYLLSQNVNRLVYGRVINNIHTNRYSPVTSPIISMGYKYY